MSIIFDLIHIGSFCDLDGRATMHLTLVNWSCMLNGQLDRFSQAATAHFAPFAFLILAVMTQSYAPYRHDARFLQEH